MSKSVLANRSGFELGRADLQFDRVVPTASGLAKEGDDPYPEILAFYNCRHTELSERQDDYKIGDPSARESLVAKALGENHQSIT